MNPCMKEMRRSFSLPSWPVSFFFLHRIAPFSRRHSVTDCSAPLTPFFNLAGTPMSNVISFSQAGKRLALLFSPPFVSSSQAGIGVTLPAETGQKERKKDEKEDAGSQMRNGVHCMGLGAAHCENSLKER
mmetsp:Transcript_25276/g.49397  ORF Transcript_25276/g.49397 Transcript_25276/m.49397 type:complete len:130 (+) Transcript_25276:2505-2894(+)